MDVELRYHLLKLIDANPQINQRTLAGELGISLGKVNYCLHALIEKGWVKAGNFRRNPDKRVYSYLLTPKGLKEKARVTLHFLKAKVVEYEILEQEISELQREAAEFAVEQGETTD